ncbi:unnamed protein product [Brassica napus]|uniref:(rape) hypothetical protein n=1 Tax=Brassica napus TaxID=3708 RepID=A0A816Z438_BRANA|nr:unnamed protein product [Brassica napus]
MKTRSSDVQGANRGKRKAPEGDENGRGKRRSVQSDEQKKAPQIGKKRLAPSNEHKKGKKILRGIRSCVSPRCSASSTHRPSFFWFEQDVWTYISRFLDGKSLVMLGATSKWFHKTVMEESIWRFACLRDLHVPRPCPVSSSWNKIYASAFDWMRIGAFTLDSRMSLLTESLSGQLKVPRVQGTIEQMLQSTGSCIIKDIKSGIWIADLQLVRCPVCDLSTCDGTMQILDTRHIELFLNEEYKAGSWDYNLIGSHKLQKDTSAACGAIYDLKHLKASSSSGILHLKSWTGEPEDSQPKAFITTHAVAVHTRLQKNEAAMQGSSIHGANSVLGSTRMDNSFVVLPRHKPQAQGIPPRPRGASSPQPHDATHSGKAMDESFVVVYKSESASDSGAASQNTLSSVEVGQNGPLHSNTSGFNSSINVLNRAFDIARTQTQVEQPLCLECMRVLSDKLEKEVEDVTRDVEAYEACVQRLEGETQDVLSEADFLREKRKIEEEERKLVAAIEESEKQNAEVNRQLKELESKGNRFNELEDRYWQEFNNFQCQLIAHQEERDAILAKIEVSQAHLELLNKTNVLIDAFPIRYDGDFGTINNFRLGRLPKAPVEWDEINAAWGQACLLLHTMCNYFRPKFQCRVKIQPMGSYPRIVDSTNSTYELFGPVNLFWSTRYDKAMTLYLICLKDFADFANAKDQENNIPPEKCLKLPFKIENDKVESYSITQSFNKQENWTKALKYTLCNLKWALYWFVGNTNFQPLSATVSLPSDVSAAGSLYAKRGPGSNNPSSKTSRN